MTVSSMARRKGHPATKALAKKLAVPYGKVFVRTVDEVVRCIRPTLLTSHNGNERFSRLGPIE